MIHFALRLSSCATALLATVSSLFAPSAPQGDPELLPYDTDYRTFLEESGRTAPVPGDYWAQRKFFDAVGEDRGPIRRIVWKAGLDRSEGSKDSHLRRLVETVDASGRLAEEELWSFGDLDRKCTYVRDSEGRVVETLEERPLRQRTSRTAFTYGEGGSVRSCVVSMLEAGKWRATWRFDYEYDEVGRFVRERRGPIGAAGEQTFIDEYEFSTNGRLVSKSVRRSDGAAMSCVGYEYDAPGRLVGVVEDDPSGLEEHRFLDDDGDGRPERQVLRGSRHAGRVESVLDGEGRIVRSTSFDAEGRAIAWSARVYDEFDCVASDERRHADDALVQRRTRAFERDAHGNVVAVLEREEGAAIGASEVLGPATTRVLVREIEYAH